MKSAYELAMERLEKSEGPQRSISDEQKARLNEIDAKFKAKIAERKVGLGDMITKAQAAGSFAEIPELEEQLVREIMKFEKQCEEEKEKVRAEA